MSKRYHIPTLETKEGTTSAGFAEGGLTTRVLIGTCARPAPFGSSKQPEPDKDSLSRTKPASF